ncbi:TIR domain-containing protein [Phthorimaea operculella]|nr:TIR domain-containing protein [Phthorimaea operculella]
MKMRLTISLLIYLCKQQIVESSATENVTATKKFPAQETNSFPDYKRQACLVPHSPSTLPRNKETNELYVKTCILIRKNKFSDLLPNYHVNYTKLESLQFDRELRKTPYPTDYFTSELQVSGPGGLFGSYRTLREMGFRHMEFPTLIPSSLLKLQSLILKYSPIKKWDNGCEYLKQLIIEGPQKGLLPKWPSNCTQLKILRLESVNLDAVRHLTESMNNRSVADLEILSIVNCSLDKLPLSVMHSKKLREIDFSHNNLHSEALLQFPTMKSLEVLHLSNNYFSLGSFTIPLLPILLTRERFPALRVLNLNATGLWSRLSISEVAEAATKLPSLKKLYIDIAMASEEAFMHSSYSKLNYLYMFATYKSEQTLYRLRLHSLPSTQAQHLEVVLKGVQVTHVTIGPEYIENFDRIPRSRFWLTNKGYKLTVHLDSVDCDCNNHILQSALRLFPHFLSMPNLKCHHGGSFLEEPAENLSCRKATVNGCIRRISRGSNHTTVVDCSHNTKTFRWPQPRGFRGFNASGNRITSLDKAYLPDSLEWLDLRNNSISRLDGEQTMHLFGNKGRRVWLTGNPIVCDCDNQPLLDALHVYQSLVIDFDNLTCADSGQLLRLVSAAELCRPKLVTATVTTSLIAVLLLVAALLIRHYWISLRMVLYAHGCCLSCLREKDLDKDRPYDAFLSFAHGDDQYVREKLLPKLEGGSKFRICVHYRDWAVGEWIPAQIMQSVRLSKRTIIVLSKNFISSCWGVLEFRHANAGAAADGRKRLLVLVLDDVLSEKLSPELQCYLEQNTYLDCKDPWFWEKLLYAMPHKDSKSSKRRGKSDRRNLDTEMCARGDYDILNVEDSSSEINSVKNVYIEEVDCSL